MQAAAYWMQDGILRSGRPEDFFAFLDGGKHVVSLVGGGGKSTLMAYLAACFHARGARTAVMTTTRIARPERPCLTMDDCLARWAAGEIAACGANFGEAKFRSPEPDFLSALLARAQAVVIEADGAHMRACKAPAAHEPVILPETDVVIGVMGLEVLGRAVGEVCHRPECVCEALSCGMDHLLTPEDLAELLLSERGSRKGVGEREFYAVLNKCDDEARLAGGVAVLRALERRGHARAVLTRLGEETR